MTEKERLNRITESIIGAAIEVHRALERGLKAEQQKPLPVVYREVNSFPDSLRSLRAQR